MHVVNGCLSSHHQGLAFYIWCTSRGCRYRIAVDLVPELHIAHMVLYITSTCESPKPYKF